LVISFNTLRSFNDNSIPLLAYYKYFVKHIMMEDPAKISSLGPYLSMYSDYFFVIPNQSRYTCIQCGTCCRALSSQIDGERLSDRDCPRLVENTCSRYNDRFTACRAYPFHIIEYNGQDILLIDKHCLGVQNGNGYMITIDKYRKILKTLNREYRNSDGVIIGFGKR
jgi:Fe-S-cluster containining protein